jgi:hypothetical protein
MMIELLSAQLGSRQMPTEVLWQAVLGVTYQYTSGHIAEALYTDYCQFLKVPTFDYPTLEKNLQCIPHYCSVSMKYIVK